MRVAQHWSLCRDDALDAYQRALEIYVRRLDSLDPATEIAWLKVVIKHEALAVRRARTDAVPVEDIDFDGQAAEAQRPVDDLLAGRERVRRSAEALRRLKPDEAKALVLKAQGLSYAEIGASQGWTYTKVNRCITEGRARFLRIYAEIEAGEECERFAPTLAALVAGTASADALLELRPHIRNCSACRATVRELHATRLGRLAALWPLPALVAPLRWLTGRFGEPATMPEPGAGGIAAGPGIEPAPDGIVLRPSTEPAPDGIVLDPGPDSAPDASVLGPDTERLLRESVLGPDSQQEKLEWPLEVTEQLESLAEPAKVAADQPDRLIDLKAHLYQWLHRLQGSELATGAQIAAGSGGGRIATVGAVIGLCLSSVGAGTVCVMTGVVHNPFAPAKPTPAPARPALAHEQRAPERRRRPKPPPSAIAATPDRPARTPTANHERRSKPEPSRRAPSRRASTPTHEEPPAAPAPTGATEDFAFEQTAPAATAAPAPAPTNGGGEFAP